MNCPSNELGPTQKVDLELGTNGRGDRSTLAGIPILATLVAIVLIPELVFAQAELTVSTDAAMSGAGAEVLLTLASNPSATAMQVDLQFDAAKLTAGTPVVVDG